MIKFKTIISKTWIPVTAAALIAGSGSIMALALDRNVPENVVSITDTVKENTQSPTVQTGVTPEYSVVDLSKGTPEQSELIRKKLSMIKGITPEQMEEKYKTIISNMTPGEKDISAEQAAAYAAAIVKKAYGVDLTGYTAQASFSKNPVPGSDNWGVIFHTPQEAQNTKRYYAGVDSVNGTMLDAGCYDLSYAEENNKDLKNPEWKNKAVQDISKLIPEGVSITGSKVISAIPAGGVTVVCELSNGSACSIRLTGENKEATAYIFFPNGYDGSLDYDYKTSTPPTTQGVG